MIEDSKYSRWYRVGEITCTKGSTSITGYDTDWVKAGISPGDLLTTDEGQTFYEIYAAESDTQLTLRAPYRDETSTAIYTAGSITVLIGEDADYATVQGNNTQWLTEGVIAGNVISFDGGDEHYAISEVVSDTELHVQLSDTLAAQAGTHEEYRIQAAANPTISYAIVRQFNATLNAKLAAWMSKILLDHDTYINSEMSRIEGKSAYDVAVDLGFTGTKEEWLESLKAAGEWAETQSRIVTLTAAAQEATATSNKAVSDAAANLQRIGDISKLTPSDSSNLTSAVNDIDARVGDISTVGTNDASSLSAAVKELNTRTWILQHSNHDFLTKSPTLIANEFREQDKEAIANVTYTDMYPSAVWVAYNLTYTWTDASGATRTNTESRVHFRILGTNRYYNTGDQKTTKPSIIVTVDSPLYSARMDSSESNTGGYANCELRKTGLNRYKGLFNAFFGADHILKHREYLCNALDANGRCTGWGWYDCTVELLSEEMIGSRVMSQTIDGGGVPCAFTSAVLPGCITSHNLLTFGGCNVWLRTHARKGRYSYVSKDDVISDASCTQSLHVKPYALIC